MPVTPSVLIDTTSLPDSSSTVSYVAQSLTIIDKAVITSFQSVDPFVVAARIDPDSSTATDYLVYKVMNSGDVYLCPELVGQVLKPGQELHFKQTYSGAQPTATAVRVCGRIIT